MFSALPVPPPCVAVLPVKSPEYAKSRLAINAEHRRTLALAFTLDTLGAVRAAPGISETVVMTSDQNVARLALRQGCRVAPDAGDLNSSLRRVASVRRGMIVVVCADLPALRPDDVADTLAQLRPGEAAYVADVEGTGTTTYAAPADLFDPRFGPESAAAHLATGARPLDGDLSTLRHDVDTIDDLEVLAARGMLGQHTCAAMTSISLVTRGWSS
jgi:2-phospho-L-lactate guanylyltransferase